MGVHDFVDFIQRNGQCFYGIELLDDSITTREELSDLMSDDGDDIYKAICSYEKLNDSHPGASEAYLVLVPKSQVKNMNDLYRWNPTNFKRYEKVLVRYSWDDWDFSDDSKYFGYDEVLQNAPGSYSSEDVELYIPGTECVWEIPEDNTHRNLEPFRNKYIVNFDKLTYECFVEQRHHPNKIPLNFYLNVLENYNIKINRFKNPEKINLYNAIMGGLEYEWD